MKLLVMPAHPIGRTMSPLSRLCPQEQVNRQAQMSPEHEEGRGIPSSAMHTVIIGLYQRRETLRPLALLITF